MKKIILIFLLTISLAFSSFAGTDGENSLSNNGGVNNKDCFEKVNRATFAFNQGLDKAIFKPVSKLYRKFPHPVRTGLGNMVNNLSNLTTIPNNILQGSLSSAGTNLARFGLNSTVGILGIFDVASGVGFPEYEKEDYGQTLGAMGMGEGCYVVLPILGPSTVRDATGIALSFLGGDPWYNITVKNDTQYFNESDYYISRITGGVDFRAKNLETIENLENNAIDFYASVKSLYIQDRQQKIINSKKIIDTQNDSDWEEINTQ
jgi:phospholipid-binding lipoprotein MlaA